MNADPLTGPPRCVVQDEYLQFHYAEADEYAPLVKSFVSKEALEFPALCAKECSLSASDKKRALDVGCAVGGSSFELGRYFDEVVGFDFSAAFIKAANELKETGSKPYQSTIEGTIKEARVAKVQFAYLLGLPWSALTLPCSGSGID